MISLWRHIWLQYRTDFHLQNSHLQMIHQIWLGAISFLSLCREWKCIPQCVFILPGAAQSHQTGQERCRLSGICYSQSLAEIPRPLATVALRWKPDTNTDRQSWHLFTLEAHQRNGLHSCIWCPATCWSRFVTQLSPYRQQKNLYHCKYSDYCMCVLR